MLPKNIIIEGLYKGPLYKNIEGRIVYKVTTINYSSPSFKLSLIQPDSENVAYSVDVKVADPSGPVVVQVEPLPALQICLVHRHQAIHACEGFG